jgi:hypothetical protein
LIVGQHAYGIYEYIYSQIFLSPWLFTLEQTKKMSLPDGAMAEPLLLVAPSSTAKEQPCTNTGKISAPVVQGAAVLDDEAKLIIQISELTESNYNMMDHIHN